MMSLKFTDHIFHTNLFYIQLVMIFLGKCPPCVAYDEVPIFGTHCIVGSTVITISNIGWNIN